MKDIVRDIMLTAADLAAGECVRGTCPFCEGGKTEERSFTVTRSEDGAVLYNCFRAKCGTSGRIGGLTTVRGKKAPRRYTPYEGELRQLSKDEAAFFHEQFGITPTGFMMTPKGRVAMPVYSPNGQRRGWSLRSYTGDQPKSLIYMDCPDPVMSWYTAPNVVQTTFRETWVVEDIPSAMRLTQSGFATSSVALLGVGIHEDAKVRELATHTESLVIALDPDATSIAVAAKRNLRLWFKDVRVVVLECDVKDMTAEEFDAWTRS